MNHNIRHSMLVVAAGAIAAIAVVGVMRLGIAAIGFFDDPTFKEEFGVVLPRDAGSDPALQQKVVERTTHLANEYREALNTVDLLIGEVRETRAQMTPEEVIVQSEIRRHLEQAKERSQQAEKRFRLVCTSAYPTFRAEMDTLGCLKASLF